MAGTSPARDTRASGQSSTTAIESPTTHPTTPTDYTLDLSALPKSSRDEQRTEPPSRGSRKRSSGSMPPPTAKAPNNLGSDEADGPEDFTINMEYWMRCDLSDAESSPQEAPPVENITLDDSMDSWISRGSEKLVAMQRQREEKNATKAPLEVAAAFSADQPGVPISQQQDRAPTVNTATGTSTTSADTVRIAELEAEVASLKGRLKDSRGKAPTRTTVEPTDGLYMNRKLAQVLGVPSLSQASHIDGLIRAREMEAKDLEDTLELTQKEKRASEVQFQKERARLVGDAGRLREDLDFEKMTSEGSIDFLRGEVRQLSTELTDARSQLVAANRDAASAREELRVCSEEHAAEIQNLQTRLAEHEVNQQQDGRADRDFAALQAEADTARSQAEKDYKEAVRLRDAATGEVETVREKAAAAITKLGRRLDRVCVVKDQLKEENDALEEEIAGLKVRLRAGGLDGMSDARIAPASTDELEKLRGELTAQIRIAQSDRADAIAHRHDAEREAAQARADMKGMNARVDAVVAATLRRREQEWAMRVAGLKGEKKDLSRALMRSWGEADCGRAKPQMYQYRT